MHIFEFCYLPNAQFKLGKSRLHVYFYFYSLNPPSTFSPPSDHHPTPPPTTAGENSQNFATELKHRGNSSCFQLLRHTFVKIQNKLAHILSHILPFSSTCSLWYNAECNKHSEHWHKYYIIKFCFCFIFPLLFLLQCCKRKISM